MTDITTQGIVDRHEFDVWFHQFQGANVSWNVDQRLIAGNFFIGLQAWNACIFSGADIPYRSEIVSATATYVTHQTGIGDPIVIRLNTPFRGENYGSLPLQTPLGWRSFRQQFWVGNQVLVRNSSDNQIGQSPITPAVPDNSWALWQQDSGAVGVTPVPPDGTVMRQRFGTKMTGLDPVGGGGQQLDYIRTILNKNGVLPVGTDVFFDIQGNKVVHGINLPDDNNILATSDAVSAATIGATNAYDFNFSGADQITIDIGQLFHAVIRLDPEPPVTGFQFIALHSKSAFGLPSQHTTFGAGVGFDWQNWPGTADLATGIVGAGNNLADYVDWSPAINPIVGSSHTTPDITAIVQAQVDHPRYESGGRFLVLTQWTSAQNPQNRVWASFNSALPQPVIDIVYRRRRDAGGGGHGARIIEPSYDTVLDDNADQDTIDAALAIAAIESRFD